MDEIKEDNSEKNSIGETSTQIAATWNEHQEALLKGISERSNCMRWLHTQSTLYFDSLNFYFTIPNVVISTLNGSFTMSLNSLFPEQGSQRAATTIIGLISILSAVLITMNQYVKSQQMSESHRMAGLAYGKMHRMIVNELSMRRDQRSNSMDFLKIIRTEQDRLESMSPSISPRIINKFNIQFADKNIEKPEITGDLDETTINTSKRKNHSSSDSSSSSSSSDSSPSTTPVNSPLTNTLHLIKSASELIFSKRNDYSKKNSEHIETPKVEKVIKALSTPKTVDVSTVSGISSDTDTDTTTIHVPPANSKHM
jgi:hypothetical protein